MLQNAKDVQILVPQEAKHHSHFWWNMILTEQEHNQKMLLFQWSNPELIATSNLIVPPLPLGMQTRNKLWAFEGRRDREIIKHRIWTVLTSISYMDLVCNNLVKKLLLRDDRSLCWVKQFMNQINKLRHIFILGFNLWSLFHLQDTHTVVSKDDCFNTVCNWNQINPLKQSNPGNNVTAKW